jgi:hypothetical protein
MAKGYNRYNLLLKIKDVCETYRENERNETADYIWRNRIYPKHFISRSTFYDYLSTPYEKELKEIEQKRAAAEAARKRQRRLFDDV